MALRGTQTSPDETSWIDTIPWPSLTALVLGGSGLIGRHLIAALLRRGAQVRVLLRPSSTALSLRDLPLDRFSGDLEDPASLDPALPGCDLLFHCAASYPRGHFHRRSQVDRAVRMTRGFLDVARGHVSPELLKLPRGHLRWLEVEQAEAGALALRYQPEREEEIRRQIRSPELLTSALAGRLNSSLHPPLAASLHLPGLKRIVYVSSVTTIGHPRGRPRQSGVPADWADEGDRHDLIRGSSPYFAMKEEMEAMVTRAGVEGLPVVIGNPTFCVDAFDVGPTSGLLLTAVARRSMPFYLPGMVNVVAARDVGEGLVRAATLGRTGQRYILGGENMTTRAFLELVAEVAGVPPPRFPIPFFLAERIAWVTEILNLIMRRPWPLLPVSGVQMSQRSQPMDCRLAREELGMPVTPTRTAVADALRWFRENGYL